MSISHLVRNNIKDLTPYSSARDEFFGVDYILLDANENPYDSDINRYPDPYQKALKQKVAEIKCIDVSKIFIGNGSDEIIDLLFRCFCQPYKDTAYALSPSYGMYKVSAGINAIDIHYCSLNSDFSLNIDVLISNIKETDKLLFICSPNNPTGNSFDVNDIENICVAFNGIVVVDEAYIDFSARDSMILKLEALDNLVVLQTMSKSWGAAGLRLGMGFMNEEIVSFMNKIKPPYNINTLSQKRALELFENYTSYRTKLEQIIGQRRWVAKELMNCKNVVKVYPADANFILTQFDMPKDTYKLLKSNGIIVRDRTQTHLCNDCLRLTIGKEDENMRMIELIKSQKG
ncbi:MAG: histidinol-phosphate transaminase [Saprospiraceae bacterium]